MSIIHAYQKAPLFNTIPDHNDALSMLGKTTLKHKWLSVNGCISKSLISTTGFFNLCQGIINKLNEQLVYLLVFHAHFYWGF
jgi:hypothetical protein